jgi:hypothetical protein
MNSNHEQILKNKNKRKIGDGAQIDVFKTFYSKNF